jgi:hypothetical protein
MTMRKMFYYVMLSFISLMSRANNAFDDVITYKTNFSKKELFHVSYADYPKGQESFYQLNYKASSKLPAEIKTNLRGLKISGNNHSDDLFMYAYKKLGGLSANTTYHVSFSLEFASNATSDMGSGGSSGDSVFVKIGTVTNKPERYVDQLGYYRMALDKGNQMQDGKDMVLIGTPEVNTHDGLYRLKTLPYQPNNEMQEKLANYSLTTNEHGDVWLILGTDSGYESTSTFFYTNVWVTFSKN